MEQSPLWQRTFTNEHNDSNVSRLTTSLRSARNHVAHLASRISKSLPELTLHDSSHLDALWTVAGTIAGDDYTLNPLEGYLFGMAVLLHDAALCQEAYSGGRTALRATVQWRDARQRRMTNHGHVTDADVDFETLRTLHAAQAEALAITPWHTDDCPVYIIDDAELRNHYGPLVGRIASSHHWDIDDVVAELSVPRPAASFLDPDWSADPLVVACLLRVADAGHIDSSRAPTFLLKILEMNATSKAHWESQNHLGHLTTSRDDPTQVVIGSTGPFRESQAPAWWVAFDLVEQLDKELKQCDAALRTLSGASRRLFARKSVASAGDPKGLARYVQTEGWEPTNSPVHVSDVAALIRKLGGEQLYGTSVDPIKIALRELIQNAADAIAARRLVGERAFRGRIRIRLFKRQSDGPHVLQVDDDGVGMSRKTLSTDLLDFGQSFWASERASNEFPGLHARRYSPTGRFGIGFFSTFMAAARVRVFSRRFDASLEDVRCLSFDNGLSLRPTLSDQRAPDLGMDVSTRVELELKGCIVPQPDRMRVPSGVSGQEDLFVPFQDYVGALVSGVDAGITVELDGTCVQVQDSFPPPTELRELWMKALSYASAGGNQSANRLIPSTLSRLREIRDGETCYGLAALRIDRVAAHDFLSAKAVGGFVAHESQGPFVGLIDYVPASARREPGEIAAPRVAIQSWLSEQVSLIRGRISEVQAIWASYSLCDFGFDPIDVLMGLLVVSPTGTEFWRLREILSLLQGGRRLAFRLSAFDGPARLESYGEIDPVEGLATCLILSNGKFNEAEVTEDEPQQRHSLVGVVHRTLVNQGARPRWTVHRNMYPGPFGRCDGLEVHLGNPR